MNTTTRKNLLVKKTNEARVWAVSAAFEGRVVVSGGRKGNADSNTAEAYNPVNNTWSRIPNMVYGRTGLALVAVRDKLFAIGGNFQATAEVYDGNKFSQLKYSDLLHDRLNWINNAVAIGSRIFISKTNYVGAQLGAEYSKKCYVLIQKKHVGTKYQLKFHRV